MRTNRGYWAAAAAIAFAALLAGACSSDSVGPTGPSGPGQLTVNLSTTGSGAAFLVQLTGSGITNPTAASSGDLFYSFASGNTVKIAVIGSHSSGALFRFSVPDVSQVSSYGVTLLEVAGSDNALQSTSGFTLSVTN